MNRTSPLAIALLGSGVIAVTYGLARFIFGLFLPAIRADLDIGTTMAGIIGALPFVSYVAAILAAPAVARTLGARAATAVTTVFAAVGLIAIARAPNVEVLALGVLICGISTGLSSPILAEVVHAFVRRDVRGRVNAAINASTSVGVLAAPLAMFWWAEAWRPAYTVFGVLAVVAVVAALIQLPAPRGRIRRQQSAAAPVDRPSRGQWLDIGRMSALAATMGFVSALYWVFAPDFAVQAGGLSAQGTAWLWLAVGIGGLLGIAAGDLVDRLGHATSHALALALLAASLTLLAAAPGNLALAGLSAAAFGAAYMTLTGLYLVGSTRIMADHPAIGPVAPFLAISCGQIVGSPAGGWLIAHYAYGTAFAAFAAIGLGAALAALWLAAPRSLTGAAMPIGED
jgi:predicted MFS family arabinose efflux permease